MCYADLCNWNLPTLPRSITFGVRPPGYKVTVHASFLGSLAEVLQSLACAVLLQDRGAYRETVQTYLLNI